MEVGLPPENDALPMRHCPYRLPHIHIDIAPFLKSAKKLLGGNTRRTQLRPRYDQRVRPASADFCRVSCGAERRRVRNAGYFAHERSGRRLESLSELLIGLGEGAHADAPSEGGQRTPIFDTRGNRE